MNRRHQRVIPVYYENEITAIWNKAGPLPWYRQYIFGDYQGKILPMKNRKYIISAGKRLTGNAPQLWQLADYLCDICRKELGEPEPGYETLVEQFSEHLETHVMEQRAGYRKTSYKQMKKAEQEVYA